MGGWEGGWMDGWMDVKAVLRIAYSNQKEKRKKRERKKMVYPNLQTAMTDCNLSGSSVCPTQLWQPWLAVAAVTLPYIIFGAACLGLVLSSSS